MPRRRATGRRRLAASRRAEDLLKVNPREVLEFGKEVLIGRVYSDRRQRAIRAIRIDIIRLPFVSPRRARARHRRESSRRRNRRASRARLQSCRPRSCTADEPPRTRRSRSRSNRRSAPAFREYLQRGGLQFVALRLWQLSRPVFVSSGNNYRAAIGHRVYSSIRNVAQWAPAIRTREVNGESPPDKAVAPRRIGARKEVAPRPISAQKEAAPRRISARQGGMAGH